ncbi:MAG: potassium transporter TrkA [bacterium]|nr:potassium transporter TrkA [bacterium]
MKRYTFWDKVKYGFDNTMSKGSIALMVWLTIVSVIMIVGLAFITFIARFPSDSDEPLTLIDLIWMGLMRTLDPGTMGGDSGSWGFKLMMLIITLGGIFIISTLIGIITTGIDNKLDELRKGRSAVIEMNHTIIFGWSEQIFTIIKELVLANENQVKSCIVILGEKDKVEMEDEIRNKVGKTGRTKVVCRQGNPIDLNDIELVGLNTSKSIIIISPDADDPDSYVIKTLLAIVNNPNRRKEHYNIVVELRDEKNIEVAQLIGKTEAEIVLIGDLISKIIAQTCRQSGLSQVYGEILSFEGNEIYFKEEPALTGKKYSEALFRYESSMVIGIKKSGRLPELNPVPETEIEPGDELIFIAEDDDTMVLDKNQDIPVNKELIIRKEDSRPVPEKTLILGWNWRIIGIVNELDSYVPSGSELFVAAEYSEGEEIIKEQCKSCTNQTVKYINADTTDRRNLEKLNVGQFNHIIILCYSDTLEPQKADAKTLITLLHLRDIAEKQGYKFSIVSEMIDIRNRNLAEITRADDFIISDKLTSQIISQVSENKFLNSVFKDIFSPEGSEIYLKPVSDYVQTEAAVDFYTLLEAAHYKKETAFGYRKSEYANNAEKNYGIKINPWKKEKITFTKADKLIVFAED